SGYRMSQITKNGTSARASGKTPDESTQDADARLHGTNSSGIPIWDWRLIAFAIQARRRFHSAYNAPVQPIERATPTVLTAPTHQLTNTGLAFDTARAARLKKARSRTP